MQISYDQQAKAIAERFALLSDHAEKLAFPNHRKGIFASKDLAGAKTAAKYIYNLTHPFSMLEKPSSWFFVVWMILYFLEFTALLYGILFLYPPIFNIAPLFPPSDPSTTISVWLSLILFALPVSIIAYTWWWETLSSRKNPWWVRILLAVIAFSALTSFAVSTPSNGPMLTVWNWNIFKNQPFTALVAVSVFLLPAISYFVAIVFDLVLFILLIIRTLFGGVASVHVPRPTETILKLATDEIPSRQPNQLGWKLADLTREDVVLLRQWAEANREGSGKRTLPASIIAAFVGVMLTSDYLRNIIDRILAFLGSGILSFLSDKSPFFIPNNISISALILFLLVMIFLLTVAKNLMALFRNIVAQNLIVEACIVAEYALPKPEITQISKQPFFGRLLSIFFGNF
jgi:hypothetical protein